MNKNLFSALRLEKLVMGIILSIITIVAAGLIVATVVMLVLEKRKEIAVLKALGVPDGGIVKIFLAEGLADRRRRARFAGPHRRARVVRVHRARSASSSTRRSITSPRLPVKHRGHSRRRCSQSSSQF